MMKTRARPMSGLVVVLATLAAACPDEASRSEEPSLLDYQVALAPGTPLRLTLPVARELLVEEREGGTRFERDGLVLRIQAVPIASEAPTERTPSSVALAMARRFELGEQQGELAAHPCEYAGRPGQCVVGSFEREGAAWARRGAFVTAGAQVLWIDVCGPADRVEEIDAWSNELASRASVRGAT